MAAPWRLPGASSAGCTHAGQPTIASYHDRRADFRLSTGSDGRPGAGCPQGFRRSKDGRQAARHATTSAPPRRPDVAGLPRLRCCPGWPAHRTSAAQCRLAAAAPGHLRRRTARPRPHPGLSRRTPPTPARGSDRRPISRLPARCRTCRRLHRRRARPRAPADADRPTARPSRARQRHHPAPRRRDGRDAGPRRAATRLAPPTSNMGSAGRRTFAGNRTITGRSAPIANRAPHGSRAPADHRSTITPSSAACPTGSGDGQDGQHGDHQTG